MAALSYSLEGFRGEKGQHYCHHHLGGEEKTCGHPLEALSAAKGVKKRVCWLLEALTVRRREKIE